MKWHEVAWILGIGMTQCTLSYETKREGEAFFRCALCHRRHVAMRFDKRNTVFDHLMVVKLDGKRCDCGSPDATVLGLT